MISQILYFDDKNILIPIAHTPTNKITLMTNKHRYIYFNQMKWTFHILGFNV